MKLDSVEDFFPRPGPETQVVFTSSSPEANAVAPKKLTTEELTQIAFPSVVVVTTSKGTGSGFFISENGVIVTNAHVVEGLTPQRSLSRTGSRSKAQQSTPTLIEIWR